MTRELYHWMAASALCLALVGICYWVPEYIGNECIYMLSARLVNEPDLLTGDYFWDKPIRERAFYDQIVVAPLISAVGGIPAVLALRLLTWIALLAATVALMRRLGIGPWEWASTFAIWFVCGQSLAAGEWMFGTAESKGLAYVGVLVGLSMALGRRYVAAGAWSGAAVSMHPLVGGWAAIALIAVVLVQERRTFLHFLGPLVLFSLPGLVPSLLYVSDVPAGLEALRILVHEGAPQHLDPGSFLRGWKPVALAAVSLAVIPLLRGIVATYHLRLLAWYLGVLMGFFVVGLLAYKLDLYWFLRFYPFRLGPMFVFLFFLVAVSARALRARGRAIPVATLLLAALLVAWLKPPVSLTKPFTRFAVSWSQYWQTGSAGEFARAARWIRENTDRGTVFLASPWLQEFWLAAERPQVLSLKCVPHDDRLLEWKARGEELRFWFDTLPRERVLALARKYGARYYVARAGREDLADLEVYADDRYGVYRVPTVSGGSGS